jgi:putative ABC transport system permease protein
MLSTIKLAAKFLWREWRAGEWFVVIIALLLAITATTAIHFYTDRLTRGLDLQSARFLGGDLAVSSPEPIPELWQQHARALQLRTTQVWSYPSVASANKQLQLVNLQAVGDEYPLIGKLTNDSDYHPARGTVWVEPRLLPLLAVALNGQLKLGMASLVISKLLTPDVDLLNTGLAIAPRLMMRLADVPETRTVIPGSRVDYRLLIAGEKNQVQQFRQWLAPQVTNGQRLLDAGSQQASLHRVLQRAQDYMQLVLLGCLMMSGVAIALSIQQYMRRHYTQVALWRCLGARQVQIRAIIFWQLTIMALIAGVVSVSLGYLAQSIFADLFKDFLQFPLPATGLTPALLGLLTSVLLLFAFAMPVVWELPRTSPLHIWRNATGFNSMRKNGYLLVAFLLIACFIYYSMDFSLLTLYFLAMVLVSICALYGLSLFLLQLARRAMAHSEGALHRGLSQLIQYSDSVSLQFVGFNLILIALLVLGALRGFLIDDWRQTLPTTTPNYFAFNIAPTDLENVKSFFQQQHITLAGLYPMVRGRMVSINQQPVMLAVPSTARDNNALHRELNLSFMWDFPADNKIVSGKPWQQQDAGKALVSVEEKLGKDMQLKLGDSLTFQIGANRVTAVIANFRSLDWSSFHPNFFMIFPPGLLHDYPVTYITSFHLPATQITTLNQLVETFPNITVIDVAGLLQQMQDLVGKITMAMQYLFLFALGDGFLIFLTCIQASLDERRQTNRILRILGASQRYIRNSVLVEFVSLGLGIVLSATLIAGLSIVLLEKFFFNAI